MVSPQLIVCSQNTYIQKKKKKPEKVTQEKNFSLTSLVNIGVKMLTMF